MTSLSSIGMSSKFRSSRFVSAWGSSWSTTHGPTRSSSRSSCMNLTGCNFCFSTLTWMIIVFFLAGWNSKATMTMIHEYFFAPFHSLFLNSCQQSVHEQKRESLWTCIHQFINFMIFCELNRGRIWTCMWASKNTKYRLVAVALTAGREIWIMYVCLCRNTRFTAYTHTKRASPFKCIINPLHEHHVEMT